MPVKEEEENSGCLVGPSQSKRQRFYIELKPGETVIVSWKKLLRDADKRHHSSTSLLHSLMDDSSCVGQWKNSSIRDERLGHQTKARSSDNKQLMVPKINLPVVLKKNDVPTRKHEDSDRMCRFAVAKSPSMLPKFISCYDKSFVLQDQQLEGLHDVPVTYSRMSSTSFGRLYRPSLVSVPEITSVIPLQSRHDLLQQNQKLYDIMSHSSARRFAPLQTYRRSKKLVDGIKGKIMAQNDDSTDPGQKRKVSDTNDRHISDPSTHLEGTHKKVAVEFPSLLSKSFHSAKSIKFSSSREGNLRNVPQKPHLKEPKMENPGKTPVKIRFHLKSDHETRESEMTQLK
ncbi:hypothetical protein vseg_008373 [Gypsophila vaccaria]